MPPVFPLTSVSRSHRQAKAYSCPMGRCTGNRRTFILFLAVAAALTVDVAAFVPPHLAATRIKNLLPSKQTAPLRRVSKSLLGHGAGASSAGISLLKGEFALLVNKCVRHTYPRNRNAQKYMYTSVHIKDIHVNI